LNALECKKATQFIKEYIAEINRLGKTRKLNAAQFHNRCTQVEAMCTLYNQLDTPHKVYMEYLDDITIELRYKDCNVKV
jgi:hypothetical protein